MGSGMVTQLTLCHLPELGLSVGALVSVRVVLQGQLVESLFDQAVGGIFGHPQYVVVVPLGQDELGDHQDMHREEQRRLCRGHTADLRTFADVKRACWTCTYTLKAV